MSELTQRAPVRVAACGLKQECFSEVRSSEDYTAWQLGFDGSMLIEDYDISIIWADSHAPYGDLVIQREKQVLSALKKGKSVVLLFSAAMVADTHHLLKPFLDLLQGFGLQSPVDLKNSLRHFHVRRQEFQTFLDRHGLAFTLFRGTQDQLEGTLQVDDIAFVGDGVAARSVLLGRGRLIMLPVHNAAMEQPTLAKASLPTLIEGVLRYLDRMAMEGDEWVLEGFIFDAEKPLTEKEQGLSQQLAKVQEEQERYQKWKAILSAKEYQLQDLVPVFLREAFGLITKQDEKFVEDFWIEDAEGKTIAIGEVTSTEASNVTFGTTGKIQSHRSQHGRPDEFQGVLVVNTFTRKRSVAEKNEPIPPNVRTICSNTAVLITRTLDLLRIYDLVLQGRLSLDTIKQAILEGSGWLTVDETNGQLLVLKE